MKKILSFLLALFMLFSLSGCQGNFGNIDLQNAIQIPENGIISERTIQKIKDENAVATFYGESNGYQYEWIIFGSDVKDSLDVNLLVDIQKNAVSGLSVSCFQQGVFGFPALLSIHTGEKWDALSATAYRQAQAMSSVSITGNKESVLNLSLTEGIKDIVIRPDEIVEDTREKTNKTLAESETTESTTEKNDTDDYLSDVKEGNERVYSDNKDGNEYVYSDRKDRNDSVYSDSKDRNDSVNSDSKDGNERVYSDGKGTGQDKYLTDPIPEGKPIPVEPENQHIDSKKSYTCTFSIECSTILNNLSDLVPEKLEMVPSDGVILSPTTVTFYEGESVYDVLQRVCKENGIHMEASWTPIYNSAYVEGIHNLYEFDCGNESGWMYRVNGWYPNYGCSRYQLAEGEIVEWRYTCKGLGKDVGCDWMGS